MVLDNLQLVDNQPQVERDVCVMLLTKPFWISLFCHSRHPQFFFPTAANPLVPVLAHLIKVETDNFKYMGLYHVTLRHRRFMLIFLRNVATAVDYERFRYQDVRMLIKYLIWHEEKREEITCFLVTWLSHMKFFIYERDMSLIRKLPGKYYLPAFMDLHS